MVDFWFYHQELVQQKLKRNTPPKKQLGGVYSGGYHSAPLVNVFTQASADIVDFHLSVVFKALDS